MYKRSIASALGASFAMVAVLAMFLPWFSGSGDFTLSGYDIFDLISDDFEYYFLPVIVSILGLASWLVLALAPKGNVTKFLSIVFGIVILALVILTYFEFTSYAEEFVTEISMAWGIYVAMASGILVAVCGVLARN